MFKANFQRTGVYNTTGVRHLRGIKWRFSKASLAGSPSSPEVANGVVYFDGGDGNLYALEAETGQRLWKLEITAGEFSNLTILNGIAYGNEPEGYICAIDLQTRQQKWRAQIGALHNSNPVIVEGVIYVGNGDGHLYAVDEETGKIVWSFKTTKNMEITTPALANSVVYIGSHDGHIYAIDAKTGQQKWQVEIGPLGIFPTDSFPVIVDEAQLCIMTGQRTLQVLNVETGQEIGQFEIGDVSSFTSSPVIANRVAYFTGSSLKAVDIQTGQELWKQSDAQTGYRYFGASGLAVADGTLYIAGEGAVYALELQFGQELWRFIPPEPTVLEVQQPTWFRLIFQLMHLLMNQFKQMTTGVPFASFSPPVISDGVVYVSCSNGYLYALH